MFSTHMNPFVPQGLNMRSYRPVSQLILDMLADGMNLGDQRVKLLSMKAMWVFCPGWFDPPVEDELPFVIEEPERQQPNTALDGNRSNWPAVRVYVVDALRDSLRIDERDLNIRAIDVAAAFPDEIVETLVRDVARTDITPGHCGRLLAAIDRNGGMLSKSGAAVLRRLKNRPGFEVLVPHARKLVWQRWEMVNNNPSIGSLVQILKRAAQ